MQELLDVGMEPHCLCPLRLMQEPMTESCGCKSSWTVSPPVACITIDGARLSPIGNAPSRL